MRIKNEIPQLCGNTVGGCKISEQSCWVTCMGKFIEYRFLCNHVWFCDDCPRDKFNKILCLPCPNCVVYRQGSGGTIEGFGKKKDRVLTKYDHSRIMMIGKVKNTIIDSKEGIA